MELPALPNDLKFMLTCMDLKDKVLTWNLRSNANKYVLNLTWRMPEETRKQPVKKSSPKQPSDHPTTKPPQPKPSADKEGVENGAEKHPGAPRRRMKTPSEIKRSKQRLMKFKESKKQTTLVLLDPPVPNSQSPKAPSANTYSMSKTAVSQPSLDPPQKQTQDPNELCASFIDACLAAEDMAANPQSSVDDLTSSFRTIKK